MTLPSRSRACGPSIANCRVPHEPKHSTRCLGTAGLSGSLPRYQRREASRTKGSSTRAIHASLTPPEWRTRLAEFLIEGARQRVDQIELAGIDIDHGEIAVDLHPGRGQRAPVPREHFRLVDAFDRPALLDRALAVVQQRLETIRQHGQAE